MQYPSKIAAATTCSYCGVGCGVRVTRHRDGRIEAEGDPEHPSNRGMLCSKGRSLHQTVMDASDRLLFPQMRKSRGHGLERVDWDTAIGRAAQTFRAIIGRYGPEAVAFYVSGQCLTEEYYIANKLMKGFIGSNNIDTNSRLCMSSAAAAYKLTLGDDACPIAYDDIEAGDCFLIAGANPAWCHPILFRRLERHKEIHPEAKVVVVDPRRTASCSVADLHLQIRPGTDVALYNAIAREIIENGWMDRGFLRECCDGFEEAGEAAYRLSVGEAAVLCDVPADDIRRAAEWIGTAAAFQSWWAMGLNQSTQGVANNLALLNLSLLTGQIGKPGAGPFSLTGQPNAMGGREVGGMAHLLAAHHDLASADHRAKVAAFWKSGPIAPKPGLTATEMFAALRNGRLRAIWIICTNPAVSMPSLHGVEDALTNAPFVIVQDISSKSDTVPYADIVLPAAGWLEKDGVMTNSERRLTYLPKVVEPPGEALPDAEILCRFGRAMGWNDAFTYPDTAAIFDEHARLTAGTAIDVSGVTHARLRNEGSVQWPCPGPDHPGTPRLFSGRRFYRDNGKAKLHGVLFDGPSERPTPEFPFILTTGRMRDQWHTMTRTGKVAGLNRHAPVPHVELHPSDAAALGVAEGDGVRIRNGRGEATAKAMVTASIKPGVVFMAMHWGKTFLAEQGRANLLTNDAADPRSKQPGFKYTTVALTPVQAPARRIAVVGAGAAALAFVRRYRERNTDDAIAVFTGEPDAFYNRVLLPGYIAGERVWSDLAAIGDGGAAALGVALHAGEPIVRIERGAKTIVDRAGRRHPYDVLVLATGSRAAVPPGAPAGTPGVFTLRNRADADRIRTAMGPGKKAVVVGGGLLALELAAALHHCGADATVLHRSGALMRAQLDATASELLYESLLDLGIQVHLHDEVRTVHIDEGVKGVRTASGRYLPCDGLFYATGIEPNAELGRDAGLVTRRGIAVDAQMRTSDPAILAIGEAAERDGVLVGDTHGAEAQARTAADGLLGDPAARFDGSLSPSILKAPGIALASMGRIDPPGDPEYETVTTLDRRERLYLKCVIHRNRLVGALLLGDTSALADFRELIQSGVELDARRRGLLRPGGESRPPVLGKLVCTCLSVGEGNIEAAIAGGCGDMASVCARTRAGSGCGSCRSEIRAILERNAVTSAP